MTSPHEREERDFFDDLSDGAPPQNQAEPLPHNGGGDDPSEEPQAASDPRAAQTEMIRIADHLPPGVGRAGTPRLAPPGSGRTLRRPKTRPSRHRNSGRRQPSRHGDLRPKTRTGHVNSNGRSSRHRHLQLGRRPSWDPRQGRARQPRRRPVGAGPAALAGTAQPWCGAARRAPLR